MMKKLFLAAACALLSGCTHLYFEPSRRAFSDPSKNGYKCEAITFNSADGTPLTGLFFPAAGKPKATVVHFHGNAQNMTSHYPYSAWLAAEGYNTFIFDYRGYGASGGKPGLEGAVQDGVAALQEAVKLPGADAGRIIVLGQSLGGALGVTAAARSGLKLKALIVEGTFYSYRQVGAERLKAHLLTWPLAWLPYVAVDGRNSPSDYIGKLDCPKLFIHSPADWIVPYSQNRRLYDAANGPKEFWDVPDGHIEAFGGHRKEYGPKLLAWLAALN